MLNMGSNFDQYFDYFFFIHSFFHPFTHSFIWMRIWWSNFNSKKTASPFIYKNDNSYLKGGEETEQNGKIL